jgi:hypothetical protein
MQFDSSKESVFCFIRLNLVLHMFHEFDTLGPYSWEKGAIIDLYTNGSKFDTYFNHQQ